MNELAKSIGMDSSNFTNSIGISDHNNYSTAADMLSLALFAMRDERLTAITKQRAYEMPKTNKNEARTVYSTNQMFYESSPFYFEHANGLKTGSSSRAKGSLVASAQKNGIRLVCVVMNDQSAEFTARWEIARSLFEYGFSRYSTLVAAELVLGQPQIEIDVANAQSSVLCEYPSTGEHYITVTNDIAKAIH